MTINIKNINNNFIVPINMAFPNDIVSIYNPHDLFNWGLSPPFLSCSGFYPFKSGRVPLACRAVHFADFVDAVLLAVPARLVFVRAVEPHLLFARPLAAQRFYRVFVRFRVAADPNPVTCHLENYARHTL